MMVVALLVVVIVVWTASKQKSRKSQLGRERKYRSLAGGSGGDAEAAGLMAVNVEVKELNAVDEESEDEAHEGGSPSHEKRPL
jgi:hypothetical protein